MGEQYLLSTVTAVLARAVCAQGRLDEAAGLTRRAEELAGADDVETQAAWRSVRATVLARSGRITEATSLAEAALELLAPTDSAVQTIETLFELSYGFAPIDGGRASALALEARQLAERKGDVVAAGRARELLGRTKTEAARAS
jgi:ATP/maltotriose-dependent transcriptional regulator MalT